MKEYIKPGHQMIRATEKDAHELMSLKYKLKKRSRDEVLTFLLDKYKHEVN